MSAGEGKSGNSAGEADGVTVAAPSLSESSLNESSLSEPSLNESPRTAPSRSRSPQSRPSGSRSPQSGPLERRLHPVTPLRRAWAPLAFVAFLVKQDWARDWLLGLDKALLTAGVVLAVLASVAYGVQSWRCTYYALTDTELRIRTGLLFRRTAHLRLDRIQAVEVAEPLLARFLGVAKLKIDVIGTENKDELAFLGKKEARALRAELLALAAGFTPETAGGAGEAPARDLARVAPRMLAVAVLLNTAVWMAVLSGVFGAVAVWWLSDSVLAAGAALLSAGGAVWAVTGGRYLKEYDWTVGDSPDGLRLDHGLLDRQHETVPPGRVQAVRIVRPLLWRMKGWMRVELDVAGTSEGVLLPVTDPHTAQTVIARILPRTDLAAVREGLRPASRRARWVAPVRWRGWRWTADGTVFAASKGLLTQTLTLVPHAKAQSVRLTQGPVKRLLKLADVWVDTGADTTVVARGRDAQEALAIVVGQAERSRTGRRTAAPDRWMSGGGVVGDGQASGRPVVDGPVVGRRPAVGRGPAVGGPDGSGAVKDGEA
ncbi:PH domain-containing protein [Streptomyces sp. MST-110588]|uniref:PH domain-containing protein n=1 Tax=Streptomyces sp. MST-110588 TaxID=2833628 RepID=UPI001F5DB92F|nr:PH domain-containing protein [Streptomyces sp. MST-110588]UNO40608.1 PH domain-containing protein [Streptomyces sp. MST-110588]